MYYKILSMQSIVGVAPHEAFCRYDNGMILYCDADHAQFIQANDILYHDEWLKSVDNLTNIDFTEAKIIRIGKSEYELLEKLYEEGEEFPAEEPQVEPEPEPEPVDMTSIDFAREQKIKVLSAECKQAIRDGFDIVLSDGKEHHFSLDITDQIQIQALATKAAEGKVALPWHADGDLAVFYPAKDILAINDMMERVQTYHTTYFNSLKFYVNSLDDLAAIAAVEYGQEIPAEYQSEVLKYLLKNMG